MTTSHGVRVLPDGTTVMSEELIKLAAGVFDPSIAQALTLSHLNIKTIAGLQRCEALMRLDLSHNQITAITATSLQSVAGTLTFLDVSFNQLEMIASGIIPLKALEVLHIHGNRLASLDDVTALGGGALPRLHTLTVQLLPPPLAVVQAAAASSSLSLVKGAASSSSAASYRDRQREYGSNPLFDSLSRDEYLKTLLKHFAPPPPPISNNRGGGASTTTAKKFTATTTATYTTTSASVAAAAAVPLRCLDGHFLCWELQNPYTSAATPPPLQPQPEGGAGVPNTVTPPSSSSYYVSTMGEVLSAADLALAEKENIARYVSLQLVKAPSSKPWYLPNQLRVEEGIAEGNNTQGSSFSWLPDPSQQSSGNNQQQQSSGGGPLTAGEKMLQSALADARKVLREATVVK